MLYSFFVEFDYRR